MSIRVMTRVWDHSRSRNGERLVLLAIADFADDHGRAFPSVASLRTKSAMSERGVQQAITRLQELGELCVEIGAGPHGVNVYWVKLSALVPQAEVRTSAAEPAPVEEYTPAESAPPANTAPPQNLRFTPAESAPKPSGNRQVTKRESDARLRTVPLERDEALAETATPPAQKLPSSAQKPSSQAPKTKPDPMAHLHRPDGWPPVLGLGDLDEPIAELYQAYRSARFPAKADTPILPGEIRKDLPTLQEMHAAGITPQKLTEATCRALGAWSDRARVTLAALAAHWSGLMDDTPTSPPPPLRPMSQGGKRRITPDEAKASVQRGLATVLTKGDGF